MPNGLGYGRGRGFGFRGSSPPWPYVGRGRGGLPRCGYFLGGAARAPWPPTYWQSPSPSYGWGEPSYWGYPGGAPAGAPFAPATSREEELDFLKGRAETIKEELEQIEARVRELEKES
jgi:hypothetical protein